MPPVDETPAAESAEPITAVSLALPAGDYERALDNGQTSPAATW